MRRLGGMMALAAGLMGLGAAGARADVLVYGIDDANRIHEVNLTAQTDAMVFNTGLTGAFNSVALDAAGGKLFYRREGSNGALYEWDMAANVQRAFGGATLQFNSADAAFHQGAYWFVSQGGDTLFRAVLDFSSPGSPTIGAITPYTNFDGSSKASFGFGDIAISATGILYGASNQGLFRVDISGGAPTDFAILNPDTNELQIALDPTGTTIYAHSHNTGQWFTIDPSSPLTLTPIASLGNPSATFTTAKLRDIAGPMVTPAVPEPASMAMLMLGGAGLAAKLRRGGRARRERATSL